MQHLQASNIEALALPPTDIKEWKPETLIPTEYDNGHFRHFYVGITLAPDLSSIGFAGSLKIGNDIGVLGEYRFSDHFAVQTGIIRAHKLYQKDEDDQHDPFYYSGSDLSLNKIDASYKVLEIPMTARFSVPFSKRDGLTLSLGVSSYLMTKERYTYFYLDKNTNQEVKLDQNVRNQNKYWFGIADFSLGYRRHLSPRIDFALDAFGKVPFAEIGEGEVQLISVGTNFTFLFAID